MSDPAQSQLLDLFYYDAASGKLIYRIRRRNCTVGKEAGFKITARGKNYKAVTLNGARHRVHRLIWIMVTGEQPVEVDHENGDGTDNRWDNLRSVDHSSNAKNMRLNSRNKSGHSGVFWSQSQRKWQSYIRVSGRRAHLGSFSNIEDAIKARKDAQKSAGYHPNHGTNRPL